MCYPWCMTPATEKKPKWSQENAEIEALALVWHRRRSPAALSDLAEACLDYISSIVKEINNPIPSVISEDDLVAAGAEGFLSATRDFDPEKGTFRTWAYKKIKGSAINHVTQMSDYNPKRNRYVQCTPYDEEDLEDIPANGYSDPQDIFEDCLPENASVILREAMAGLPHRQRNILALLLNGLTPSQVGRLYDSTPNFVHNQRRLAVATLSDVLADKVEVTVEAIMAQ